DPMTWAKAPYATGTTSIAMTATTASDPNGVQYYFTCTAGGGNDSGWQDDPNYVDTGLAEATQYTYTVKARDKSSNQNETMPSTAESATTYDESAPTPDPATWASVPNATGPNSISMTATTATDPSGVQYYFEETSGNPGATDSGWQAPASYTDTGLDDLTQYTYRVRAQDLSANQNTTAWSTAESATTQDGTAPTPDPMTWAVAPYTTGPTSISMTATPASDPSGVEYYFEETSGNPGATDSGWQNNPTYVDTGLDDLTQYTYTVKARDKSTNQNEGTPSTAESATTEDGTPPAPDPMTWASVPAGSGATSISMTATTASDPSGVEYYFDETSGNPGATDSGWQNSPSYEDTGLDQLTLYTYTVKARDKSTNQNETAWSTSESAMTGDGTPPTPDPMTWATPPYASATTSIAMVATTASDASGVEYYFTCTIGGGNNSGWQDGTSYEDTGLAELTQYTYTVVARDKSANQNETSPSTGASATTGDATPPTPDPMSWAIVPYATGVASISMTATPASDASGVEYYFDNLTDPDPNHDSGWQDNPTYVDTGLADLTLYTYTVKARDKSSNQNETAPSGSASATTEDGTAPTPDPATWASEPNAISPTSITMTATTATDASGVEYYFTCTAGGGNDSGWQDTTTYLDSGLADLTLYTYTVKARDKSANKNTTADSTGASATTPDGTAPTPDPATWATVPYATGPNSIAMTATTASDPSGVEYYFTCTAGGGNDSGWQNDPNYEDTGLDDLVVYTYRVKARDKSPQQNETAPSTAESVSTGDGTPPVPDPMSWAIAPYDTGPTTISMTATPASDPSGVEYYFAETSGNPGGSDSGWQDSPTYVDSGLDDLTEYIYTVKARDKSFNQNETAESVPGSATTQDGTAPAPDPATWASVPIATGPTSISMTATTATDASGVRYYFDETSGNPGATDSGWQAGPSYTDTGLSDLTQYTYRVQARDLSANQNTTAWSTAESATTEDGTPPTPDPMTWASVPSGSGPNSISMTATTASDPSGVEYYFEETSGNPGGADSGWQDGTTYEDTSLAELTQYTYIVRARDKSSNQNETAWSTSESATTGDGTPPAPDPMTWASVPYATGPNSIAMTATTASDPSGVEYYFANLTDPNHDSDWQNDPNYEDAGLAELTQYTYTAKARDKSPNQNETAASTAESATTEDGTAPMPDPMTWVVVPWAAGPNSISMTATTASDPSGVEYYFTCTAGGGNDSGWRDDPNYADTGLADLTEYTYTVRARDKSTNQNETAESTAESATTQDGTAPAPDPMTWATAPYATGTTSIAMVATTASDPNGVQYYFAEISGNPGGDDSGWQDSTT
ncbi:MAG: hypothetical protein ACYS21_04505, partial [Planctomycetota bacterium]